MFLKQKSTYAYYKGWLSLSSLALILVLLVGCGGSGDTAQPTPTPTSALGAALGPMTALDLGIPKEALNAPITGTIPDDQILHVGVTFKTNQAVLDKLGKQGKTTPGEKQDAGTVANQLGISDETYQKIKAYFGIENATVKLGKLRTNITVDAKAGSFARLLQTRFVTHKLNDRTYYTPDPAKPAMLPKAFVDQILAVTGLDNYSQAPQHFAIPSQPLAPKRANTDCQPTTNVIVPSQVAHAYGYDQLLKQGWHGENMTINLVEIDGFDPNDISNYFQCVGFSGKLEYKNVDTDTSPAIGPEATLDLDMIAGLAPAAHIVVYQTDISTAQTVDDVWTQVNDALQQIIEDNANNKDSASVVSISLGMAEKYMTQGNFKAIDQSLNLLTSVEHMTTFIASGDCGAYTSRTYKDLSVSFPASDPYAVAVGGTILNTDDQGARTDEAVWSDGTDPSKCHNQWGSGGGLSSVFPRPDWEQGDGVSNQYSTGERQMPDVAAVAYDLAVYYQGHWVGVGGTSAAAPIWASGMILMNQGLIAKKGVYFYGPKLFYAVASQAGNNNPYYDVTKGNNLYYAATSGWDYSTGFGTPNLPGFYNVLYQAA